MPAAQEEHPFDGPTWIDRVVLPFVREPILWPILLVVIGHAAAFGAPMLLMGVRDRSLPALGAAALLAVMSVGGIRAERRLRGHIGAFSAILLSTWALSLACAWIAHRYEIF